MKVTADTQLIFNLPVVVTAVDYHEFAHMQDFLRTVTGNKKLTVTAVGFDAPKYVGLVHLNTTAHQQVLKDLEAEYEEEY